MSESSVDWVINNFLHAVDHKLEIQIPSTPLELSKVANDWNLLSTAASGIYFGVVGAIDGWLATI